MAEKDQKGRWIDGRGESVPPRYVNPIDKRRDALVEKILKQASEINKSLAEFKAMVFDDIDAHIEMLKKEYDVDAKTKVGNKTLTNFSVNRRVDVRLVPFYEFDERLKLARAIITKCVDRWSKGSNKNIKKIVNRAFEPDKRGFLDRVRIMELRDLDIDDPDWTRAMTLIKDSVQIQERRAYIQVYEKGEDGKWKTLPMDLARV